MTYLVITKKKQHKPEATLPSRNSLCFLMLALLLTTFNSQATDIENQLRQFLNTEINRYLTHLNSNSEQRHIALFVPKASKQLACADLTITRAKPTAPPAGRIRLKVSCEQPIWQFRATAKVDLWLPLVIAKRDLQRGETLTQGLLDTRSVNIANHLNGMESQVHKLVGMTVKRNIKQGEPITRRYLENDYLVNKDQHIKLQISTKTFTAKVKAIALEEGVLGQLIKVKNLSSGKVIEGKVIAKGVVKTTIL